MVSPRRSSNGGAGMRLISPEPFASSRLLVILHHLFAFAPAIALASAYVFSWRVAVLIGHWPRPSLDDPKFAAPGDELSILLYFATMLVLLVSASGLYMVPLLSFVLRHTYSRVWRWLLPALWIVSWLLLRLDPGARITWFAD